MTKIDTSPVCRDLEGAVVEVAGKPLTVGRAMANAVVAQLEGDAPDTPDRSIERSALALRCLEEDPIELTNEEAAEIAKRVARAWGPVVAGPICGRLR